MEQEMISEMKANVQEHKDEYVKARTQYFGALVEHQIIEELDIKCKRETLQENNFLRKREKTRILDPIGDYDMSEKDFEKYCKIVDVKRKKAGLQLPYDNYEWAKEQPWNLTSDCESRINLGKAKKEFLQIALKIMPTRMREEFKELVDKMKYPFCDKFLELSLRLDMI